MTSVFVYTWVWTLLILDKHAPAYRGNNCRALKCVVFLGGWLCWVFVDFAQAFSCCAEAEAPILCPPDAMNWLIRKDSDAEKYWRQEEKGTTEDEMVGWHYWLFGHEFVQAPGVGDGQGSLACCSPWGRKESDMTERLNWTELVAEHRA